MIEGRDLPAVSHRGLVAWLPGVREVGHRITAHDATAR